MGLQRCFTALQHEVVDAMTFQFPFTLADILGLPFCQKRAIVKTESCRLLCKTDVRRRTCEQGRGHESEMSCEHGYIHCSAVWRLHVARTRTF